MMLLSIACGLRAQTAPDAAELTKLLQDFLAGAGRNDAAMHERFWADELIYTSALGRRKGKADILREVREEGPPKPGGETRGLRGGRHSHPAIRRHCHRRLPSGGDDRQGRGENGHQLSEHRHVLKTKRQMAGRRLAGNGDSESTHANTNTVGEKERAAELAAPARKAAARLLMENTGCDGEFLIPHGPDNVGLKILATVFAAGPSVKKAHFSAGINTIWGPQLHEVVE